MQMLPKILLIAAGIVFVVAVVLSFFQANLIAGPNGWLDMALVLAVFSIAVKIVCEPKKEG